MVIVFECEAVTAARGLIAIPCKEWPCGKAFGKEDFKRSAMSEKKDYGDVETDGLIYPLICRSKSVESYKVIGVCFDGWFETERDPTRSRVVDPR